MAIKDIRETFGNIKRLREVLGVLNQHGFGWVLLRLGLDHWLGITAKAGGNGAPADSYRPAERLVAALEELGPTYIKFGQVLATRSDILPREYTTALARLQDKVEPLPYEQMKDMLRNALPRPAEEIFASFDSQAITSGSIGQVYFATLFNGSQAVVKVKRPGTDLRMREDLSLLRFLAGIIQSKIPEAAVLGLVNLVDEFARGLNNELNFLTEAAYTEKFYQRFTGGDGTNPPGERLPVRIPKIYWEFSGRDVLVEERLPGRTLAVFLEDLAAGRESPAVAEALAATLTKCFLEQYFVQGFFHSDPHPGNLLVLEENTLGIIDFGQAGQLSQELQRHFIGLLIALGRGDTDAAVELCCAIGIAGEDCDLRDFRSDFGIFLNRFYGVPFNRLRLGEVINEAMTIAQRHGLTLPRDLVLLAKSLVTIQGLITRLAPGFRLNEAIHPFINRIMKDWLRPQSFAWGGAFYLYRLLGLFKRLPEDLRDLVRKAGNGKIRIIFHHEGLEAVGDQVERASNRITLGLLIAAILLGSSIILAASPDAVNRFSLPLLDQVPLSAIIAGAGYLSAMGLGFWLAWAILRGKRL